MALDKSVSRFVLVGVGNTLGGLAVIYLIKLIGLGDVSANAIGYSVGLTLSFLFNKRWTFQYNGATLSALARFLIIFGLAYIVNLAIVLGAIHALGINSFVAQALGIPAYALVGYAGSRWYVFSHGRYLD